MSGRLGAEDLAATVNTLIYTAPIETVAAVTVNVCNRNAAVILTRLAVVDGVLVDLAVEDYIEYDSQLCNGGVLERTGIVLAAGQSIVAYSDTANVSVQVWGWEEGV